LKELKAKIDFLLKPRNPDTIESLYIEINNVIRKRTHSQGIPYVVAKKSYQKKLVIATKFIEEFLSQKYNTRTPVIRQKTFWLFSQLIAEFLQECSLPITIGGILNNYQKFPSLLDKAFPDYGTKNILKFIFKKKQNYK
jgi:hypothetical protein